MSLEQTGEQIKSAINTKLLAKISLFRKQRLQEVATVLDELAVLFSADHKEQPDSGAISAKMQRLHNVIAGSKKYSLADLIVNEVQLVVEPLPEHIDIAQDETRFKNGEKDAWYLKAGKSGKRLLRTFGKKKWQQQIPLQKVVQYHLLDEKQLFAQWIDYDERLFMDIILAIEKVFVEGIKESTESTLLQQFQQQRNDIKMRLDGLEEAQSHTANRLESSLVEALAKVDTLERRAGFYHAARLQRKQADTRSYLQKRIEEWQHINIKLLEKSNITQQFLSFCGNLETHTANYKDEVEAYLNEFLLTPLADFKNQLAKARQEIEHNSGNLSELIQNKKDYLSRSLENEILVPFEKSMETARLQKVVQQYSRRIMVETDNVNEKAIFISSFEGDETPPEIKSRSIEWRLLVVRGIKEKILSALKPEGEIVEQVLNEQLKELKEIQEIIEINLESSLILAKESDADENPAETADDALERTESKLEKCRQEIEELRETIIIPVTKGSKDFADSMMHLLYHSDTKTLTMLDAKYKVSEKTLTWRTKMNARWARAQDKGAVLLRFVGQKANHYYTKAATLLGFKKMEVKESEKADIAAFLSETERRMEELPYIYRQLFAIDTPSDSRYYIGVNENFAYMRKAYERWNNAHSVSCAILGEKGSGKSTYITLVQNELFNDAKVFHIDLNKTAWTQSTLINLFSDLTGDKDIQSIDELALFLNEECKDLVILFEGIHNLYLRQLNGYEGVEALAYLISETSDNAFWVVSCSRYAWGFLDEVTDISNYFSHFVRADSLSENQIEEVILKRHRSSGYELVFEPEETTAKSRSYRKLMDDEEKAQAHLRDKYFEDLTELSEGNASIAMIFWIRSIREFDDTHFYIAPLEATSLQMLDDLNATTLFVLAALVLHDTLNPAELSAILGIEEKECKMIFNRLKAKGILVENEKGMNLNQLMYRQTIRELKERNILHLG